MNFTVISNIDSLTSLNDRAVRNGWITSEETAGILTQKLALARKKIEEGQKEKANDMIKSYINEIDIQRGKTMTGYGADILTAEAAYVYISLFSPS